MFSLASFEFPSKIVVNILVTSISLPIELKIPLKDEMKKNLSVLHFYDNFSSPLFFHIRRKQCNKFIPSTRIPPISSPPPLVREFYFMASGQIAESHQSNYSFHTRTVIGDNWFFPDELRYHNNSVIRCLRFKLHFMFRSSLQKQLSHDWGLLPKIIKRTVRIEH